MLEAERQDHRELLRQQDDFIGDLEILFVKTERFCWSSEEHLLHKIMPKQKEDFLRDSKDSIVKPEVGDRFFPNASNELSGDGELFERQQEMDDNLEILFAKETNDLVGSSKRKGPLQKGVPNEGRDDFVGDLKVLIEKPEIEDKLVSNASNQLVVYEPLPNEANQVSTFTEPPTRFPSTRSTTTRVLPSIGTFSVQCADCLKWRVVPTKEEYEAIRETIIQHPFVCEYARKWRPDISCDDPQDLEPDDTRIWAIDKPNICQPPPGWDRLIRIRGEGSTRFADIYYTAPTGKRLRSLVEVQKFLLDHPEYMHAGVNLSQFSFQIPKPLNDAYVRKRSYARSASLTPLDANIGLPKPVGPEAVNPLAWADPTSCSEMGEA